MVINYLWGDVDHPSFQPLLLGGGTPLGFLGGAWGAAGLGPKGGYTDAPFGPHPRGVLKNHLKITPQNSPWDELFYQNGVGLTVPWTMKRSIQLSFDNIFHPKGWFGE